MIPSSSFQQAILVQMFRRWAAARQVEVDRRHAVAEVYRGPGEPMMAAIACDSLFALVEEHLGRPLVPGCCCGRELAPDEAALLGLLHYAASADGILADTAIPHGLSGAIAWAARAVRRELGFPRRDRVPAPMGEEAGRCPFHIQETVH